jgi:hypothetical protein
MKTIIPLLALASSVLSARADYDFSKMIQPVPLTAKKRNCTTDVT